MFKVIKPQDATYDALNTFMAENAGNFDYNGLAAALNAAPVGAILQFNYRGGKLASLRNALSDRGLTNGADFSVSGAYQELDEEGRPKDNSPYLAVVKRLSDKEATLVVAKPRGRAKKSEAATESAPSAAKVAKAGKSA